MSTIYVLEGADASGKSTLAKYIMENKKAAYIHATYCEGMNVLNHHNAIKEAAAILLKDGNDVIIDRLCFSEYAYGTVFRNSPSYDVAKWWNDVFVSTIKKIPETKIVLIFCKPTKSNFGEENRFEMFESMNGINEAYEKILPAGNYYTFDYQQEPLKSILNRVHGKE